MLSSSLSTASLSLALGKVLVAAAWADGEIQPEEKACIEDLIFYLPGLKSEDVHTLALLLHHPLPEEATQRYVDDLLSRVETDQDKNLVLYALGQLIQADGVITAEELSLYQSLEAQLQEPQPALSVSFRNLFQSLIFKRQSSVEAVLGKDDLSSFIHKTLEQLQGEKSCRHLRSASLEKLVLEGILLSRVIWADGRVLDSEIETILQHLKSHWKILPLEAPLISQLLLDPTVKQLDLKRICRAFANLLLPSEKESFLAHLFEMALADGVLSTGEMDAILEISAHLKLGQDEFDKTYTRYAVRI